MQVVEKLSYFIRIPFIHAFGKAIADMKREAMESSKGELFRDIMHQLDHKCGAWYLHNIDPKNVPYISRLRMRGHRLAVEVGSWYGFEREERTCYTCDEVEDETHFVMQCPRYANLRDRYILDEYKTGSDARENLISLLVSKDKRALDNLGIFIRKSLEVHQRYAEALLALIGDTVDLSQGIRYRS